MTGIQSTQAFMRGGDKPQKEKREGFRQQACGGTCAHLGEFAAREVEDLLAKQLEDDHGVLTQRLARLGRCHNVWDECGPLVRPVLLQHLQQQCSRFAFLFRISYK